MTSALGYIKGLPLMDILKQSLKSNNEGMREKAWQIFTDAVSDESIDLDNEDIDGKVRRFIF